MIGRRDERKKLRKKEVKEEGNELNRKGEIKERKRKG